MRVKIRYTHPNLYRSIMTLSLMSLGLAVNFWTSNPTFNPVPKDVVGVVFFLLGASQIVFLHLNLRAVRIGMAISAFVMLFWGLTNTEQSFAGDASFQLPILYLALGVVQLFLLIESPVNPMTEREP